MTENSTVEAQVAAPEAPASPTTPPPALPPMGTHTKRGERRKAVLLRLTAAEHAALRALAEAAGQNQSQFVRGALYSVPGFVEQKAKGQTL